MILKPGYNRTVSDALSSGCLRHVAAYELLLIITTIMMENCRLASVLRHRVLVLDGAMGTMIQKRRLPEQKFRGISFASHPQPLLGCNDILCISSPETIKGIHREYLEAGADIVSTDTFNANRFSMADYGVASRVGDINRAGAALAREAVAEWCADNDVDDSSRPFVAGSMGPSRVSLSIALRGGDDPSGRFDDFADACHEQVIALAEGGVDILLLETLFDTLNAKAAIAGIMLAFEQLGRKLPVMISATLSESGLLLSGQSLAEFVEAVSHVDPVCVGLNCGFGAEALLPHLQELSALTDAFVSVHPNAGIPDGLGCYPDSPEKMASVMAPILEGRLVNIVGGCCGTTPEHIRQLASLAAVSRPRIPAYAG